MITSDLDNMAGGLDALGDEIVEEIEGDARAVMGDALQGTIDANYKVSGETAGSWSAVGPGDEVDERSEGVHPTQDPAKSAQILGRWNLNSGETMGFGSDHPAMVRLAAGSSDQMKPGWIETQLKKATRKAGRRTRK